MLKKSSASKPPPKYEFTANKIFGSFKVISITGTPPHFLLLIAWNPHHRNPQSVYRKLTTRSQKFLYGVVFYCKSSFHIKCWSPITHKNILARLTMAATDLSTWTRQHDISTWAHPDSVLCTQSQGIHFPGDTDNFTLDWFHQIIIYLLLNLIANISLGYHIVIYFSAALLLIKNKTSCNDW